MTKKLENIMLIDDNEDDNFYHVREINKYDSNINVIIKTSGSSALECLIATDKSEYVKPDLIFLDINMPGMNGWDFLNEYSILEKNLHVKAIITMLTTSDNPDDIAKSETFSNLSGFITKPLTRVMVGDIVNKYFV